MKKNGFTVKVNNVSNAKLVSIRDVSANVPRSLRACHTALIDGYVIEGHVSASQIKQLLKEKPDVVGISVPGMPVGSPGMTQFGQTPESKTAYLFKKGDKDKALVQLNVFK